ncbi:hypothetical protein CSPAE12_01972 [Colletotrichum incanum]|nr:hypothetical protein CSPAE12_01972 [Colletotrichum incanum]
MVHWNPNLDDQAPARANRIGQTREVMTKVMKAQKIKKQPPCQLLLSHEGTEFDDSLGSL